MTTQFLHSRSLTILIGVVVVYAWGCKENSTGPPRTPAQYRIAYVNILNDTARIYTMNADGTNQTRLTSGAAAGLYPEWSYDGRKIVYIHGRGDAIYVMNANGTNQTSLSNNAGDDWVERPAWSPDGMSITFTGSLGPGMPGVFIMKSDGSNEHVLASGYCPVWSPDGTKIVFLAGNPRHLFTMNADGTNQLQITHAPLTPGYPNWSRDGSTITFTSDSGGAYSVCTIRPDGTNLNRLTNAGGGGILSSFSPDGAKILFGPGDRGSLAAGVHVINADGSNQQQLADSAVFPTWSPDGANILYYSAKANYGLCLMKADGTNQRQLTSGWDWYPAWSPVIVP